MTTKEKAISLIQSLRDDVSLDDVIDRLYLLRKVELGVAQADGGDVMEHHAFMDELEASSSTDNPYQSPEAAVVLARRTHFPPFITGLIGLAMGAGFYGVLCAFLLVAYFVDAPGTPAPREGAFMIGSAVFHLVPLSLWLVLRRKLYQVGRPLLWLLAIGCWLLMPLSGAWMILNLGL